MANQNANGVINGTDTAFVAPSNMGKGVWFNPATNKYDVLLSQDETNLLQHRDDGLYFGYQPEHNIANLFVANSGDDGNDGSRERPLKTLEKVKELLKDSPTTYTVWLHEGDTFHIPQKFYKPYASIIIRPYGSQSDTIYPPYTRDDAFFRGYMAKEFNRPILVADVKLLDNLYERSSLSFINIQVFGCHIKVNNAITDDNGITSGLYAGIFTADNTVTLSGCILERLNRGTPIANAQHTGRYRDDVLLRGNVMWITSEYRGEQIYLAHYAYTKSFTILAWNTGQVQGSNGIAGYTSLINDPNPFQYMENQVNPAIFKFPSSGNVMVS